MSNHVIPSAHKLAVFETGYYQLNYNHECDMKSSRNSGINYSSNELCVELPTSGRALGEIKGWEIW